LVVLLTAIILAGLFYWQTKKPAANPAQITVLPTQSQLTGQPLPSTENKVSSSTPAQVKGEISRGNVNKKQIIFTFDCGSGDNSAQEILAVAQKHNLKLTFFSTGKFAQKYPDLIKQIAAAGHEVFNHTFDHPHMPTLTDGQIKDELNQADEIISALTGTTTKPYFRPPYGDRNEHVLQVAGETGYQSVYWTLDALDWETGKTGTDVKQRIYANLKNGEIILMHVGDDITGQVIDEVFTNLENQDYKIVSLSEGLK